MTGPVQQPPDAGAGRALPRGGKRPGAGAPTGNLNALKNGARSRQLRALFKALSQVPLFRTLLLHQHMTATPKASRARLRRLYLQTLARSIAASYIQSNGTPHPSRPDSEKTANNQNPSRPDPNHNPPTPTP